MRILALVLACLVHAGFGRRVHVTQQRIKAKATAEHPSFHKMAKELLTEVERSQSDREDRLANIGKRLKHLLLAFNLVPSGDAGSETLTTQRQSGDFHKAMTAQSPGGSMRTGTTSMLIEDPSMAEESLSAAGDLATSVAEWAARGEAFETLFAAVLGGTATAAAAVGADADTGALSDVGTLLADALAPAAEGIMRAETVEAIVAAAIGNTLREELKDVYNVDATTIGRILVKSWDDVLDNVQEQYPYWHNVQSSLKWADDFNGGLLPVEPAANVSLILKSGTLPQDLAGAYVRVGPNPLYWPPKKRTHVFDGDGMVHTVRIVDGEAMYHCQWLETPRLQFERGLGQEWFTRVGELQSFWGLAKSTMSGAKAGISDLQEWEVAGVANTAVTVTPEGKLWALYEAAPPFRFRLEENGFPTSLGYDTLNGTHEMPMSAHPKIDQREGEIFFHGREMMKSFYVARVEDDQVADKVHLDMPTGFHHDMIITEKYLVLIDGSVQLNPGALVDGSNLWKMNSKSKLRFGVIRRDCKEMKPENFTWIEAPSAAEIVHTLYAFDDVNETIQVWAPMSVPAEGRDAGLTSGSSENVMRRVVIDLKNQSAEVHDVEGGDAFFTEFPRIRDDCVGHHCRYGFSALQSEGSDFNFTGILKWDFKEGRLSHTIKFPPHVVGGEPVFLPKDSCDVDSEGDAGYIGLFLWDYEALESTFVIYNATSMSSTPVAELLVPRRVPLGFHAAWLTEDQFQDQLHAP